MTVTRVTVRLFGYTLSMVLYACMLVCVLNQKVFEMVTIVDRYAPLHKTRTKWNLEKMLPGDRMIIEPHESGYRTARQHVYSRSKRLDRSFSVNKCPEGLLITCLS